MAENGGGSRGVLHDTRKNLQQAASNGVGNVIGQAGGAARSPTPEEAVGAASDTSRIGTTEVQGFLVKDVGLDLRGPGDSSSGAPKYPRSDQEVRLKDESAVSGSRPVGDAEVKESHGNDALDGGADVASYALSDLAADIDRMLGLTVGGRAKEARPLAKENAVASTFGENLIGDDGDNLLVGGTGDDTLVGGAGNDTLVGNAGNDTLDGGADNDRLDGGSGNDSLSGGLGADSYVFGQGYGADSISDFDSTVGVVDAIDLAAGILPSDVVLSRSGSYGLVLSIAGTGDRVTVDSQFLSDDYGIEEVRFADGVTVWDRAALKTLLLTGSDGNDTLIGFAEADVLDGGKGNDTLDGREGDDTLLGGEGADTLIGGAGNDRLDGGAGNDRLQGGLGADVYLFGPGSGADTIFDADSTAGVVDAIEVAAGVLPTDVTLTRSGPYDMFLSLDGTADGPKVSFQFLGATYGIEEIRFAGSTVVWDEAIFLAMNPVGTSAAETISGTEFNDTVQGQGGDDTLHGLAGNDTLQGGMGDDDLHGDGGADRLFGGAGNDDLKGDAGADHLDGGDGIDRARYWDSPAAVIVDLIAGTGLGGEAEGDTLVNIEDIQGSDFGDTMIGDASANELDGRGGDDILFGGEGGDILDGDGGNDTLDGGAGNDELYGNAGIDNLLGGSGDDDLKGDEDADRLDGGDGIDRALYWDSPEAVIIDLLAGTGLGGDAQGDTLVDIENVQGSGFDDMLIGDGGANALYGRDGDDTLQGGSGNDNLHGDDGIDRLLGGSGNDDLKGDEGADYLDGGDGIDRARYWDSPTAVTIDLVAGTGLGGDAQGDTLIDVEDVQGSDFGDTLTGDAGANELDGRGGDDTLAGGGGDDILDGDGGDDTLDGGAGDDSLYGNAGIDHLLGGAGDDYLKGDEEADHLDGGAGDDQAGYSGSSSGVTVDLGAGTGLGGDAQGDTLVSIEDVQGSDFDDTLIGDTAANDLYGRDGADTLLGGAGNDYLKGDAGADHLDGGAGYDEAGYWSSSSGVTVDLVAGTGLGGDAQGDTLVSIEDVQGSDFADTLLGDGGGNWFYGRDGADTLNGGGGNDRLDGGADNDLLTGGLGADTFVFRPGGGADTITDYDVSADTIRLERYAPSTVTVSASGSDTIVDLGAGDQITIVGVSPDELNPFDFV